MARPGLSVGMAVAALITAACGVAEPGEGPGTTPFTTSSTTSPAAHFGAGGDDSLSSSYGPAFPLTLHRTGGIAGYDDHIVLEVTGRVSVETRSVHGRVCALSAPLQRQLVTLLATLRLESPSATLPTDSFTPVDPDAESDPITIAVTDHQARGIDLSDPSLGEIAGLVGTLVSDVTLSVPATTRCTTPTPPVVAPAP